MVFTYYVLVTEPRTVYRIPDPRIAHEAVRRILAAGLDVQVWACSSRRSS